MQISERQPRRGLRRGGIPLLYFVKYVTIEASERKPTEYRKN